MTREGVGRGWRGRVGSREGEEDGMGVSGSVGGVGIGSEGQGVEHALNVVFLDRGEKGLLGSGEVGEGGGDRFDVRPVHIFTRDELKPLIPCCLRAGLEGLIECSFPHHVADTIADLEKKLHDVGGEGGDVEGERANLGDMGAQGAVDPAAFDAQHDAQVNRDPLGFDAGSAVSAPTIPLVGISHDLEQLGRVVFKAVAVGAHICRPGPNGRPPVDVGGGVAVGW